ncbi:stage 0 sporulation family protein [Mycoplasmatota bacterium]|nr:stage 0 sporulation family protein [Mycoplasmatota bacterium]
MYEEKEEYKVIAVRFKNVGKKYFFDPRDIDLKVNDKVLVETIRGIEFGEVVSDIKLVTKDEVFLPIKPIIRKATDEDLKKYYQNKEEESHILDKCQQLIIKNELSMRLLGCEYTFDRTKLIIYFSAENRIDFRQLVKDLASIFRTRIELRQVGVRDAAKYIGGLGPCGRVLCCNTFLGNFDTVSIKMAKNQNLSLNPQKISGACGKLLCCLRYESEFYDEMSKLMPRVGEIVTTPDGEGKVFGINALLDTVKVIITESSAVKSYQLKDINRTSVSKDEDEAVDEELLVLEKE